MFIEIIRVSTVGVQVRLTNASAQLIQQYLEHNSLKIVGTSVICRALIDFFEIRNPRLLK